MKNYIHVVMSVISLQWSYNILEDQDEGVKV